MFSRQHKENKDVDVLLVKLLQIGVASIICWSVFYASGKEEYSVAAMLLTFILLLVVEFLWRINNNLTRILKQEVPEAEE